MRRFDEIYWDMMKEDEIQWDMIKYVMRKYMTWW